MTSRAHQIKKKGVGKERASSDRVTTKGALSVNPKQQQKKEADGSRRKKGIHLLSQSISADTLLSLSLSLSPLIDKS
jgi:hypothetical protein